MWAKLLEMERSNSSSLAVVEEPAAARVLTDAARLRFLLPFIGRERIVSDVASELAEKVDAT